MVACLFVSPVIDWCLAHGVPCLVPKVSGDWFQLPRDLDGFAD